MPSAWINGQLIDDQSPALSVHDTGLLHGAGAFTTMRAYAGRVFRLADHLQRLRKTCEALYIPLQHRDQALVEAVERVLSANGLGDARLRLTVTRGRARQDALLGMRLEPTAILTAAPFEAYPAEYYERGMTVLVLDDQKLNPYDLRAGHKTVDYFSRLYALKSAGERGAGEALWFNVHNYLQSGSISNIFLVKDGAMVTPPTRDDLRDKAIAAATPYPRSNVLPGITRGVAFELAREAGIPVRIGPVDIHALLDADEVFLTNSIMGIMPVRRIERKAIGEDRPGPVTRRIADLYADAVRRELA